MSRALNQMILSTWGNHFAISLSFKGLNRCIKLIFGLVDVALNSPLAWEFIESLHSETVFQLESKKMTYSAYPELEFWMWLIANGDHTEKFGRFGHFQFITWSDQKATKDVHTYVQVCWTKKGSQIWAQNRKMVQKATEYSALCFSAHTNYMYYFYF